MGRCDDPWDQAATFLVRDAHDHFQKGKELDANERNFGLGVTYLNLQPVTVGNIERAQEAFEEIIENEDASQPLKQLARFHLARIKEFYLPEPDRDGATREYIALIEEKSGIPLVEYGAARAISLVSLGDPEQQEANIERVRALEAQLQEKLLTKEGRRQFRLSMAGALNRNKAPELEVLEQLQLADQEGLTRPPTIVSTWLQMAEIANRQGKTELAREYYSKVLEKFPRDPRRFTIQQRLEALNSNDG